MAESLDVAVIGAGPFGLSVAAHLQHLRTRVFGHEMRTWRELMPRKMEMRSAWHETNLSAPFGSGTIDHFIREVDERRIEPIPLELFIRYAAWFADRFVHDRDPSDVALVEPSGPRYRITTTGGDIVEARQLVIAVGVTPFAHVPRALAPLLGAGAALATNDPNDAARYAGRRVLVVGGGQGGLETAGLTADAGAEVELVSRSPIHWFADREPHTERGRLGARLYRLAYPAVGYGPPPLNRLVLHPDLYAALPRGAKQRLTSRLLRPGGSPSLRPAVEGRVRITDGRQVARAERDGNAIRVGVTDGTEREVDQILVACGYRFELDKLAFLSSAVRSRIAIEDGWPALDRFFRSSDENVLFVGFPAEGRFGPISRFILGADFTATRIGRLLGS